jgi:hypothetical protein
MSKFNPISWFEDLFNMNQSIQEIGDNNIILSVDITNENKNYKGYTTLNIGYIKKDTGSFIIIINSKEKGGPNAIYCISRSDISKSGTINKLVKSDGINDDELELTWNPYEYPLLQIRTKLYLYNKNTNQNRIDFTVNVITTSF